MKKPIRFVFAKLGPNSYFGEHELGHALAARETRASSVTLSCELVAIDFSVRRDDAERAC